MATFDQDTSDQEFIAALLSGKGYVSPSNRDETKAAAQWIIDLLQDDLGHKELSVLQNIATNGTDECWQLDLKRFELAVDVLTTMEVDITDFVHEQLLHAKELYSPIRKKAEAVIIANWALTACDDVLDKNEIKLFRNVLNVGATTKTLDSINKTFVTVVDRKLQQLKEAKTTQTAPAPEPESKPEPQPEAEAQPQPQPLPPPKTAVTVSDSDLLEFLHMLLKPSTKDANSAAAGNDLIRVLSSNREMLLLPEQQHIVDSVDHGKIHLLALGKLKFQIVSRLISENYRKLKLAREDFGVMVDASGYYEPLSAGEVRAAAAFIKQLFADQLHFGEAALLDLAETRNVLTPEQLHEGWLSLQDRREFSDDSLLLFLHQLLAPASDDTIDSDTPLLQDLNSNIEYLLSSEQQQLKVLLKQDGCDPIAFDALKYQITSRLIAENYHLLKLDDEDFGVEIDECGYYQPRNAGEVRAAAAFIKALFDKKVFTGKLTPGEKSMLELAESRDTLTPEQMHECWLSFQDRRVPATPAAPAEPASAQGYVQQDRAENKAKQETATETKTEAKVKADVGGSEVTKSITIEEESTKAPANLSEDDILTTLLSGNYSTANEDISIHALAQWILQSAPQFLLPKERLVFTHFATNATASSETKELGDDFKFEYLAHLVRIYREKLDALATSGTVPQIDELGFHAPLSPEECQSALRWMLRHSLMDHLLAGRISKKLQEKLQQAQSDNADSSTVTDLWQETKSMWLGLGSGAGAATTATMEQDSSTDLSSADIDENADEDDLFAEMFGDDSFVDEEDDYFDEVDDYVTAELVHNSEIAPTPIDKAELIRALDHSYLMLLQEILLLAPCYPEPSSAVQAPNSARWLLIAADTLLQKDEEQQLKHLQQLQQSEAQDNAILALAALKYQLTARFIQQHFAQINKDHFEIKIASEGYHTPRTLTECMATLSWLTSHYSKLMPQEDLSYLQSLNAFSSADYDKVNAIWDKIHTLIEQGSIVAVEGDSLEPPAPISALSLFDDDDTLEATDSKLTLSSAAETSNDLSGLSAPAQPFIDSGASFVSGYQSLQSVEETKAAATYLLEHFSEQLTESDTWYLKAIAERGTDQFAELDALYNKAINCIMHQQFNDTPLYTTTESEDVDEDTADELELEQEVTVTASDDTATEIDATTAESAGAATVAAVDAAVDAADTEQQYEVPSYVLAFLRAQDYPQPTKDNLGKASAAWMLNTLGEDAPENLQTERNLLKRLADLGTVDSKVVDNFYSDIAGYLICSNLNAIKHQDPELLEGFDGHRFISPASMQAQRTTATTVASAASSSTTAHELSEMDLSWLSEQDQNLVTAVHQLLHLPQMTTAALEAQRVFRVAKDFLESHESKELKKYVRDRSTKLQDAIGLKYLVTSRLINQNYDLLSKLDFGVSMDPCGYHTPKTKEDKQAAALMIIVMFKPELSSNELMFFRMAQIDSSKDVDAQWQQIKDRVQVPSFNRWNADNKKQQTDEGSHNADADAYPDALNNRNITLSEQEKALLQEYMHHIIYGVGYNSPTNKEESRAAAQWLLDMFDNVMTEGNAGELQTYTINGSDQYLAYDSWRMMLTSTALLRFGSEVERLEFNVQVLENSIGYREPVSKKECMEAAEWLNFYCGKFMPAQYKSRINQIMDSGYKKYQSFGTLKNSIIEAALPKMKQYLKKLQASQELQPSEKKFDFATYRLLGFVLKSFSAYKEKQTASAAQPSAVVTAADAQGAPTQLPTSEPTTASATATATATAIAESDKMDRSAQEALLLQEYKHHIINGVGYQSPLSKEGSRSAAQWLLTMFEPFFSKTQQKNLQKIESKGISSTKEYLQLDALRASITAEVLKQIGVEADQVAFRVQVLEHSIGYPTPRYKAEFNKSASWILSQCDGYIDAQDQATLIKIKESDYATPVQLDNLKSRIVVPVFQKLKQHLQEIQASEATSQEPHNTQIDPNIYPKVEQVLKAFSAYKDKLAPSTEMPQSSEVAEVADAAEPSSNESADAVVAAVSASTDATQQKAVTTNSSRKAALPAEQNEALQEYKQHIIYGVGYKSPNDRDESRAAAQWMLDLLGPFLPKYQKDFLHQAAVHGIAEYWMLDNIRSTLTPAILSKIGRDIDSLEFRIQVLEQSMGYRSPRSKKETMTAAAWLHTSCGVFVPVQYKARINQIQKSGYDKYQHFDSLKSQIVAPAIMQMKQHLNKLRSQEEQRQPQEFDLDSMQVVIKAINALSAYKIKKNALVLGSDTLDDRR